MRCTSRPRLSLSFTQNVPEVGTDRTFALRGPHNLRYVYTPGGSPLSCHVMFWFGSDRPLLRLLAAFGNRTYLADCHVASSVNRIKNLIACTEGTARGQKWKRQKLFFEPEERAGAERAWKERKSDRERAMPAYRYKWPRMAYTPFGKIMLRLLFHTGKRRISQLAPVSKSNKLLQYSLSDTYSIFYCSLVLPQRGHAVGKLRPIFWGPSNHTG